MQEVSTRIERMTSQLDEIEQQVAMLEDTQAVHLRLEVFRKQIPVTPPPEAAEGGSDGDEPPEMRVEESLGVTFTLDRYTEVMAAVLNSLKSGIKEAGRAQDDVNARFAELASWFGERPAGVKEHDWWATVIKFVKLVKGVQSALIKEQEDAAEQAERKARRAAAAASKV